MGTFETCSCGKKSTGIVLTDAENGLLPEHRGPDATQYIFQNKLGTDFCQECLREKYHMTKEEKLKENA